MRLENDETVVFKHMFSIRIQCQRIQKTKINNVYSLYDNDSKKQRILQLIQIVFCTIIVYCIVIQ